ncbi:MULTISPECIES: M15 family metallopeptidase [Tessaracoccus]|uniref:M15 family metallopeptidase n=1 Tax=Tessaracoccus TaxID=72763 RepID=UPI000A48354E|nr:MULTISPECIES: M15 family metallopeptidase [Tessaracoccus]VEP39932.1 hypothetical protein TLA_TLA_01290 [Tessaracoccus lapidicaptus]
MKRKAGWLIRGAVLAAMVLGLTATPPAPEAAALDVYTTPGTHELNGRTWRTACEAYSPSVERCRTEIEAHQVVYTGGRYVMRYGWTFNNLTYKPSSRVQWIGNILATPGEHTVNGRRWKTECDSAWTGVGACRSLIWSTTYQVVAGSYVRVPAWVFNNIVNFAPEPVTDQFCAAAPISPPPAAGAGPDAEASPTPTPTPAEQTAEPEPSASDLSASPTPEAPSPTPEAPSPTPEALSPTPETLPPTTEASSSGPEPSPSPVAGTTSPSAEPDSVGSPAPTPAPALAAAAISVTPTITSVHHPHVAGALYDRLGPIMVTGTVDGAPPGTAVTVVLQDADGARRSSVDVVTGTDGAFRGQLTGGFAGRAMVVVTSLDAVATRAIDIGRATTTQSIPTRLDPVAVSPITGRTTPAIPGAMVTAQVRAGSGWQVVAYARPATDGSYSVPYSHRGGWLGTQDVRICVTLPWGATIPSASATTVTRARLANPVVTQTTADEVATTYRAGCPVAPWRLRTIRINQQSMDGHVYRGELIVRSERASEVVDAFRRAFEGGFPVYQMTNPNAFGGNDPRMMAANNTSAFNCRRVVGNPYALSPHSYGYAVDVNPWQNPYRDPSGKWWPSTEHVSRTPVVPGQLTETSIPVVAFKSHGWRWFAGWDWHHFEKR